MARGKKIFSYMLPHGMYEDEDLAGALRAGVPEQPLAPVRVMGDRDTVP